MYRLKVPTEFGVCSSCGDQISTDGETLRCRSLHESKVSDWPSRKLRRFAEDVARTLSTMRVAA